MIIVTADQIDSRHGSDRVPQALALLADLPVLLPYTRTVGDEVQGVPTDGATALAAVLRLVRDGGWSVGIGLGPARLAASAPESDGEAFVRARAAVERAKGRTVPVPVALEAGGGAASLEPFLHLLGAVVAERSPATWRVLDELATGASGVAVAQRLDITPQAVSRHRRAGLWDTEVAARQALAALLDEASLLDVGPS